MLVGLTILVELNDVATLMRCIATLLMLDLLLSILMVHVRALSIAYFVSVDHNRLSVLRSRLSRIVVPAVMRRSLGLHVHLRRHMMMLLLHMVLLVRVVHGLQVGVVGNMRAHLVVRRLVRSEHLLVLHVGALALMHHVAADMGPVIDRVLSLLTIVVASVQIHAGLFSHGVHLLLDVALAVVVELFREVARVETQLGQRLVLRLLVHLSTHDDRIVLIEQTCIDAVFHKDNHRNGIIDDDILAEHETCVSLRQSDQRLKHTDGLSVLGKRRTTTQVTEVRLEDHLSFLCAHGLDISLHEHNVLR